VPTDRAVAWWVTLAAAVLTAGTALLPPVLWVVLSHERMAGSLEAEVEINSRSITQIVGSNPDLWEFEQDRISELLARRPRQGIAERRRVLNGRGELVAESADPISPPLITRAIPLLDSGQPVGRIEISRSLRPLLLRAGLLAALLLPAGLLAFLLLRNLPLRALRRSSEALRRERDAAQRYLDVAGVLLVVLDEGGRVTRVNRKGLEILGLPEGEVIGRDWLATFVVSEERAHGSSAMEAARSGGVGACEYSVADPSSGTRRILSCFATPIVDERGARSGLLLSGTDVTRQRQLEGQLRQADKLRAIGLLAGGVAHDFNGVLSQIKAHAAVLRADLELGNPHRLDADEILAGADRAAALTSSLLTFSRRQAMTPEKLDLVDLVRGVQRRLRRLLRDEIALALELPAAPLPALADGGQIEQLLVNLVTNAQEAIKGAGRVVVAVSALDAGEARREALSPPGGYARISVTDDGAGLDAETLAQAFEPFFTTKDPGKGPGLGLAMAFGIAELHHGSIRIASEPGRGATVTFLLPLRGAS
jgi:PAS domain S-box-containing protein